MKLLNLVAPPRASFDNKISEILHRAEYRHLKNSLRDFIEQFQELISLWLKKLFARAHFTRNPNIPDKLATVIIILGLVLIFAVLVIIAVKIGKAFDKKSKVRVILGEKISERTTPGSLREKAGAQFAKGDTRGAIRYDFIALLLLMHEKRIIYIDETKTNQEIYSYLKKNSFGQISVFQDLIDVFNSSWYGHKNADSGTYARWQQQLDLIWNEVIHHEEKS